MCKNFSVPNLLSMLRILLTPFFVFFLFQGGVFIWVAISLFTIAAITDFFDGYIARSYNLSSHLGSFLDPIADKITTCSAFISFSILGLVEWCVVLIIVTRDIWITGLRLVTVKHGSHLKTSMLAKCKTAAQLIAIAMLFITYLFIQRIPTSTITKISSITTHLVVYIVAITTLYSGLDYIFKSFNQKQKGL